MMFPTASTIEKMITAEAVLGRMCRNMTRSRAVPEGARGQHVLLFLGHHGLRAHDPRIGSPSW